jgi:hypothetical protein
MNMSTTTMAVLPLDAHLPQDRDTLRSAYVQALLAAHRGEPGATEHAATVAVRLAAGVNPTRDLATLQKALRLHAHANDRRARAAEVKAVERHAGEVAQAEADIRAAEQRRDIARRELAHATQLTKQSAAWAGELQALLKSKTLASAFAALT